MGAFINSVPTVKVMTEKKEKSENNATGSDNQRSAVKKFDALFTGENVFADENEEAKLLYDQSRYGEYKDGKYIYSLVEGLFLLEKGRIELYDEKNKKVGFDEFMKIARKVEPNFWVRYAVYKDMRNRGYIVKTALKFGADFRVYDRGVKPGEDHARWVLFPVSESVGFSWHEFSAKNRVAHSTRKKLLIGVVDDEQDVTYYEVGWKRP